MDASAATAVLRSRQSQAGFTLTELVIVTATLAIVAAIAVPSFNTDPDKDLELVAEAFADAMRFARSESIRTGDPHGFRFLTNQYRIRVFTADTSGSPWTWVWDVYHPVTKQLYDYRFPTELAGTATPVTHSPVYRGTCDRNGVIYFDANGTPRCLEPETILLESYRLDIVGASDQRTVSLDGITGRVTVQ